MDIARRLNAALRLAGAASAVTALLALASASAASASPASGHRTDAASRAARPECVSHIINAERSLNIPTGLLLAVSLVESGGSGTPSPYAMNIAGRAAHPRSTEDAAKLLRDRNGRVRDKVTAGCMQLSVAHHKGSFSSVEKIVDPKENVWYAARLLVRLRGTSGTWSDAVARFNGGGKKVAAAYQCKVQQRLTELGSDQHLTDSKTCRRYPGNPITAQTRRAYQEALAEGVS